MKERIAEYSHCFNHNRENYNLHESDSIFGSLESAVSFCADFEPSIQSRSNLYDDMPLPALEQKNDLLMSLFHDFAPQTSIAKDATKDVQVSVDPPTPSNHSYEFKEGEELESASEFNEHRGFNESEDNCVWKSCKGWLSPLI